MGHSAEEKIKILYEDSLREIREITNRIEAVATAITATGTESKQVDLAIRNATRETLSEHKEALGAQSNLIAQQTRKDLLGLLGQATARMADNMAAHGRQQSLVQAVGGITLLSAVIYVTAYLQGGGGLGMALMAGVTLLVGMAAGGMMCYSFFPRAVYIDAESTMASDGLWSDAQFKQAAVKADLSNRTLSACHDVLVLGKSTKDAAQKNSIDAAQVSRGVRKLSAHR